MSNNVRPIRTEPATYRVLRAFRGPQGMYQPGQTIDATGWPWGRARILAEQRYLEAVTPEPRRGKERIHG